LWFEVFLKRGDLEDRDGNGSELLGCDLKKYVL